MFFVPGVIIAVLTFPGVIVHELAHQLFCRWLGVAVLDVCYFRFGNPAGYVVHEPPRTPLQSVLIGVGPFLVNSILGVLIAVPAAIPVFVLGARESPLHKLMLWLGISIAMYAFPSTGDAAVIWQALWRQPAPVLVRLIGTPLVGFIYLGALGSIVWLDVLYGFGIIQGAANLVVRALA